MVSQRAAVLALVGPTGTGKSALADALAQALNGEVISADSMQVYRGMNLGTAKVPPAQRSVPYHCLDLVKPGEPFNAAHYQHAARAAIADIFARGKLPLVCGGTGLYVRAALDDFHLGEGEADLEADLLSEADSSLEPSPTLRAQLEAGLEADLEADSASLIELTLRAQLEAEAQALGAEAFHARLAAQDPKSAARIHPHNVRRVVRAFEWLAQGSSYASQAQHFDAYQPYYPCCYLGLDMPREQLYPRINQRVLGMLDAGLLEEVRTLLDAGFAKALTAQQAIGYKELVPVLAGNRSLEEATALIQQATRRYAKRQKSWFRRDKRIHWLDGTLPLSTLIAQALDCYNGSHGAAI